MCVWKRDMLARPPGIQSNYGPHRGVGKLPIKLDVFELAIERFPYLRKETEGQRRNNATQFRCSRRPLDLPIYEEILSDVSISHGRTVNEVFGAWGDWGPDWEKKRPDAPLRRIRTRWNFGSLCFYRGRGCRYTKPCAKLKPTSR